ncbi:hypothetical protein GKQ38_05215 [Candidatus Nanohaloarchaea archaeon]|nr:hypothetical protein GKQ38_05215 [Candidatus Nanohaloarchaea archaeon]
MNVATKVVGALVLVVILISALFGIANHIIKDSGQKGVEAGNKKTGLLGCVSRNAHRENPRQWCKQNTNFAGQGDETVSA